MSILTSILGARPLKVFTIPASKKIPAASASSPTSKARSRIRSCPTRSAFCATSSIDGAVGADPRAGDGAGILVQIPHAFFARKTKELGFTLPQPGEYAVGALFIAEGKGVAQSHPEHHHPTRSRAEQLTLLGWRDVPVGQFLAR